MNVTNRPPIGTRRSRHWDDGNSRKGSATILVFFMLIVTLALAVFAIDYGNLLVVRTDLQRAADEAALAAVQDLTPDAYGAQDLEAAKATVREYARDNLSNPNFQVDDQDIVMGRYEPESIYNGVTILNSGIYDTVRVTLRRDDLTNTSVTLMFAQLLGIQDAGVSATSTAVLQKVRFLPPGTDILPIALPLDTWNQYVTGDDWTVYGDGRLVDSTGNEVPGNWGTLDIGNTSNSTSDIKDQILNGLRQSDLDDLYQKGVIPSTDHIDSQHEMWLNGDTGFSSGMKDSVGQSHGRTKLIPIFDVYSDSTSGGNLSFHVVGWGVIEVVDSYWQGGKHSYVIIRKAYAYDGDFGPHGQLDDTTTVIPAAYTSPTLVE